MEKHVRRAADHTNVIYMPAMLLTQKKIVLF